MNERRSFFSSPAGGVMTREVGAITGELELHSTVDEDGALALRVRYAGADEWYAVEGGPYRLRDARDAEVLHEVLVAILNRPAA
ncbi:hypothetical protein SAMN06297387_104155 [Streptomyces zhaozhouensis]|uniref:Uncharacterized protein n=1 Tax=Streptomyces zhaozhouensis TaxID=1300267 RepID=A0A286DTM4_9ACTN|nr:hypothetical protein [Streptomyces zhaozhouensis]SOD61985.1 hypothetical protein SAMN06297387_104155 [Streptomyces zhaozhouensis]